MARILIATAAILVCGLLPLASGRTETHKPVKKLKIAEQPVQAGEVLYLLAFKGTPKGRGRERNFYEFAREIYGFFDPPPPRAGAMRSEEVRYGSFATMKAEVLRVTDSKRSPQSLNSSLYVILVDSIYRIFAKSYTIHMSGFEGELTYRDCLSGVQYDWSFERRRPFNIYEVRMLTGNIARELWERKRGGPLPSS